MTKRSSSTDYNPSKESGTGREHRRYLARLTRCFEGANMQETRKQGDYTSLESSAYCMAQQQAAEFGGGATNWPIIDYKNEDCDKDCNQVD
jgi:hypothetical protein